MKQYLTPAPEPRQTYICLHLNTMLTVWCYTSIPGEMQFEYQHTIPVSKGSNITGTGWAIMSDINVNTSFSEVKIFFQSNFVSNIQ